MSIYRHLIMALATGGGVGLLPKAPGTLGTLVAIPLAVILGGLETPIAWALVIGFSLISVGIAHAAAGIKARHDPQCVVIDEIAGFLIAVTGHPVCVATMIGGFILFRLFDITKPGPVGWCDRQLKGGLGIVMDDVVAGVLANISLWALIYLKDMLVA